ncbi:Uncharacterized protein PCOAH_00020800 [Plasmodium coatneyi]|uniref:CBF1-interacting co-repressor CIR N-terminal domain-containing protein n=1 Tax=Plasmodium coatneyi TaxID=208452 RepID=A0A1B1DYQ5_9APIC|nr:Uncharacterized protein PCOAH_00020800 [Plasmodium coatneyi]ANQ07904.1 Uncharacterized protein PCOAH_00020800 [Plasmodium coatneyi]
MGGHGGLNILPQKKWNVYRKDRQFKVNYDENKLIKEEEKKVRKKNEQAFENTISQLKQNVHQGKTHQGDAYQNNQNGKNNHCEHINLFAEEEKEINERNKKHEEFLIKKGHYIYNDKNFNGENCIYDKTSNAKIVSDFDKIKLSQNEWYLRRQSSIFAKTNELKELKAGNRDDDPFCDKAYQRQTDHLRRSDSSESDTHRHGKKLKRRDRKRNKEKEKKKKYDHIKKLIKYKKDKEKRERKKSRKR